jgi:hypothetical protein
VATIAESLTADVPGVVIADTAINAKATLVLVNRTATALTGPAKILLKVSADSGAEPDSEIALMRVNLKLAPGATKRLVIKVPRLISLRGAYHLRAQLERRGAAAEAVEAAQGFTVVDPVADLRFSPPVLVSRPASVAAGGTAIATLHVENLGNIPARGRGLVELFAEPVGGGGERVRVLFPPGNFVRLNLKSGAAVTFKFRLKVPAGLDLDLHTLVAEMTAGGIRYAIVNPA